MEPALKLDISKYLTPLPIWSGIYSYVKDNPEVYSSHLPISFSEDDLLKVMKKQAQSILAPKEYDTFRKAITAIRKGTAFSIKKENLFRLLFVLKLGSDTAAQDFLLNYIHQSELSPRNLDEFIIICALKLTLSWDAACTIRMKYASLIADQPLSPSEIAEGQTAEVYYSVIRDRIDSVEALYEYLDVPENIAFFSKTCNTQYLALFDDVQLESLYTGENEMQVRLYTEYGIDNDSRITMQDYYYALYNMSEEEILALSSIYEDIFMSYDNFCLLVQRKRPVNVSSGLFLLGLFKKLLTDDADTSEDFYLNFLDSEEFTEVINDILTYFGFPVLNPELDPFERLIMDTYHECLENFSYITNSEFQQVFINSLWTYLKMLSDVSR